MKRTGDVRDRAGGSDPRKSEEDEAVDRISGLPDFLLLHILSFLPFRCAVRASLMLRPFRGLWTSLSSLSFQEDDFHTCDRGRSGADGGSRLWNFVDHVLALHESPEIHRLRIVLFSYASISPNPEYDHQGVMSSRDRLDEWIFFALKKKVKVLDVNLLGYHTPLGALLFHCRVPSAVFTTSSLVELNLSLCHVEFGEQIQLKSLQKLWMCDVILSEEVMRKLVLGSPLLKKVSLRYCSGLRVLKLDRHPSLEELNVRQCRDLEKVDLASSGIKILAIFIAYPSSKIICPNVSTLELDGPEPDGVNLDCGSSLNDAALYFHGYGDFFLEDVEVETLLGKLRNIAYFSLANWIMLRISWDRACNFDGRSYWYSVEGTFHCLAHHLKKVMIYACVTEPYVIELIEFLLGNALVLETMVISAKRNFKEARNGFSCFSDIGLEEYFTSDMLLDFSKKAMQEALVKHKESYVADWIDSGNDTVNT
ncbi:F-box/LRR-repeat protein At3g03360-like [Syzygium oleosum]|uniref:F-box/LRR-repeat protein At3g03360-like n=1 Tax=Syzygium oleosum TaxID=219896 RepID=UPI0024BBC6F2|nr:F-box/LRR-repeat protein At3g03360-like [Syzygium oleosum]